VHLLDAAPDDRQKASELPGQPDRKDVSVDPGLSSHPATSPHVGTA
jgi:hypothetical protein